jgi:DNA mismatch repair ATPase MutL
MRELSMHILDLVQNSVTAGASAVTISIIEDLPTDQLEITISDNGRGMDPDLAARVTDPFCTTRTTRKVGLGIPLFQAAAERCGGGLQLSSKTGEGTTITARFQHSHLDRAPFGNMADTISVLIACNPDIEFTYHHTYNGRQFCFRTTDMRQELSGTPINTPPVLNWVREYLNQKLDALRSGTAR